MNQITVMKGTAHYSILFFLLLLYYSLPHGTHSLSNVWQVRLTGSLCCRVPLVLILLSWLIHLEM